MRGVILYKGCTGPSSKDSSVMLDRRTDREPLGMVDMIGELIGELGSDST